MTPSKLPDARQVEQAEELLARLQGLPRSKQEEQLELVQDAVVREFLRELLGALPNPGELPPGFSIRDGVNLSFGTGAYFSEGSAKTLEYPATSGRRSTLQIGLHPPDRWTGAIDATAEFRRVMPAVPWFTMEYIEGTRIADPRRDGTTFVSTPSLKTTEQKVRCVRILCDALDHAHRSGRRHLDLTPMNVLLKPDGTPVLIDFGLTERVRPDWNNMPWTWRGTLPFMAPEQLGQQPTGVGRATDVWV